MFVLLICHLTDRDFACEVGKNSPGNFFLLSIAQTKEHLDTEASFVFVFAFNKTGYLKNRILESM